MIWNRHFARKLYGDQSFHVNCFDSRLRSRWVGAFPLAIGVVFLFGLIQTNEENLNFVLFFCESHVHHANFDFNLSQFLIEAYLFDFAVLRVVVKDLSRYLYCNRLNVIVLVIDQFWQLVWPVIQRVVYAVVQHHSDWQRLRECWCRVCYAVLRRWVEFDLESSEGHNIGLPQQTVAQNKSEMRLVRIHCCLNFQTVF